MATHCFPPPEQTLSTDMQRLLRTASQQPWGPGREIDATVYTLHQELLKVLSRLGSTEEQPNDLELAHSVDHDLRNKLMIFQYHEQKRSQPPMPFASIPPSSNPPKRSSRHSSRLASTTAC